MQTLNAQAQQTIEFQQQRLSPYMPPLGTTIAKTYLIPFGGLLLANVAILFLSSTIPGLFAGLIGSTASFLVFFVILFYGWRFSERRWHGTSLFIAYTSVSKARRVLENEIKSDDSSDATIQQYLSDYVQLADNFITIMHNNNLVPEIHDNQIAHKEHKR